MTSLQEQTGMRLKKIREENQFTQRKLADVLHVAHNTISQYENGLCFPKADTLVAFADAFDVTTDYLLGIEDECGVRIGK